MNRNLLRTLCDADLHVIANDQQARADLLQSQAAKSQGAADAARKELRRRKRDDRPTQHRSAHHARA